MRTQSKTSKKGRGGRRKGAGPKPDPLVRAHARAAERLVRERHEKPGRAALYIALATIPRDESTSYADLWNFYARVVKNKIGLRKLKKAPLRRWAYILREAGLRVDNVDVRTMATQLGLLNLKDSIQKSIQPRRKKAAAARSVPNMPIQPLDLAPLCTCDELEPPHHHCIVCNKAWPEDSPRAEPVRYWSNFIERYEVLTSNQNRSHRFRWTTTPGPDESIVHVCRNARCLRRLAELLPDTEGEPDKLRKDLPPENHWTLDELVAGIRPIAPWIWQLTGPQRDEEGYSVEISIGPDPFIVPDSDPFPEASRGLGISCKAFLPLPSDLAAARTKLQRAFLDLAIECVDVSHQGPGSYIGVADYKSRVDIRKSAEGKASESN